MIQFLFKKHIRAFFLYIVLFAFFLVLAGCASVQVNYDYDRGAQFSEYKTYSWIRQRKHESDAPAGKGVSPIRAAVDRELAAKGYVKVAGEEPDFKLAFHTDAQDNIDVHVYGYSRWRRPHFGRYATVDKYKEGTLVLDVVDAKEKRLVWRGWGSSKLRNPNDAAEKIDEVVTKILEKFPPKTAGD